MVYIVFNALGLILDLIGFIGIYLLRRKDVAIIREGRPYYISRKLGDADIKSVSEEIMKEVNRKLRDINRAYNEQQKKSLKYFLLVVIGVAMQIISLGVYFIWYY